MCAGVGTQSATSRTQSHHLGVRLLGRHACGAKCEPAPPSVMCPQLLALFSSSQPFCFALGGDLGEGVQRAFTMAALGEGSEGAELDLRKNLWEKSRM